MTWLLMALTGIAAYFFGRYYRAEAAKWRAQARSWEAQYAEAVRVGTDRVARQEAIILDLKGKLAELEEQIYAARDPAAIRFLFERLFPPPAKG